MYILIYIPGTDEDPVMEIFPAIAKLNQRIDERKLYYMDYAIVEGQITKAFASSWDTSW